MKDAIGETTHSVRPGRIGAMDVMRGLVIILMAFDHVCDFFLVRSFTATDLTSASAGIFISRWITHLCAPAFVFLAGTSAYLWNTNNRHDATLSYFLFTRGLILVIVEQTLLRCFGWYFNFDYHYMNGNVLFGIGCSMMLLSLFVRLPAGALLVLGLSVITLHGLSALVPMPDGSWWRWVWIVLFRSGDITFAGGYHFYVSYPVIPWFGIMAFGYGAARGIVKNGSLNRRVVLVSGIAMLCLFCVLRYTNLYGENTAWVLREDVLTSILSFINCEKYPPSLLFTLLTLGIGSLLLLWADKFPSVIKNLLGTFGRVPFFFYLLHVPIIHLTALIYSFLRFGRAEWLYRGPVIFWYSPLPGHPEGYGLGIMPAICILLGILGILFVACKRYGTIKSHRNAPWMKYL